MNICIKRSRDWLTAHPKTLQWAWFAGLWCSGLSAVYALAFIIRLIMPVE